MNITRTRLIAAAAAVAVSAGMATAIAAPAEAATAHFSLSKWEAFHYADSGASIVRHWNSLSGRLIYAPWAGRGSWSKQNSCWAGVTGYGVQAG
jgi:hypothetical protein